MKYIKGPDFPTGRNYHESDDIESVYDNGKVNSALYRKVVYD